MTADGFDAIVVAGPTASGKSALALELARRLDGVVINADSQQVYAELRILTARPSSADEALAPHRLYGAVPASEACSAERWRRMAVGEIAAARTGGRRPILVGGTGLYLRALVAGLATVPPIPEDVRLAARKLRDRVGPEEFHRLLAAADPEGAGQLAPGDAQRVLRAWEVVTATGHPLVHWQRETGPPADAPRAVMVLLMPPRLTLQPVLGPRLRRMAEEGALDEVARLLALGLPADLPAMKAVGVPELGRHLRGEGDLDTALADATRATQQYAKRQLTWFRHQAPRDIPTHLVVREQFSERLMPEIFAFLRRFRLTR